MFRTKSQFALDYTQSLYSHSGQSYSSWFSHDNTKDAVMYFSWFSAIMSAGSTWVLSKRGMKDVVWGRLMKVVVMFRWKRGSWYKKHVACKWASYVLQRWSRKHVRPYQVFFTFSPFPFARWTVDDKVFLNSGAVAAARWSIPAVDVDFARTTTTVIKSVPPPFLSTLSLLSLKWLATCYCECANRQGDLTSIPNILSIRSIFKPN